MKVSLLVGGVERNFTEEELIGILENHFGNAEKKSTQQEAKPIQRPTEGVPFEVNPLGIDRKLFQEERKDPRQEETRQLILQAFTKMDEYPTRYGNSFKTLMPEKTWHWKCVSELIKLAKNLGGHNADWVEQALEWAQRISNGETWEDICNNPDTANWCRLIKWKKGYYRLVGGSRKFNNNYPASDVGGYDFPSNYEIINSVPLVVLRDEN